MVAVDYRNTTNKGKSERSERSYQPFHQGTNDPISKGALGHFPSFQLDSTFAPALILEFRVKLLSHSTRGASCEGLMGRHEFQYSLNHDGSYP